MTDKKLSCDVGVVADSELQSRANFQRSSKFGDEMLTSQISSKWNEKGIQGKV